MQKEPSLFIEEPLSFFVLRVRGSKTPHFRFSEPKIEESFFLQSLISGPKIKKHNLRSSAPKNEEWVEDRTVEEEWGVGFLLPKNSELSIFHFLGTKNEEPPSSTFTAGRTDEESPWYFFFWHPPPGHRLPSAILRSGSSDRWSTLKIGPEIEIGPLIRHPVLRDPAPPPRRAPRPDPPVVCSGFSKVFFPSVQGIYHTIIVIFKTIFVWCKVVYEICFCVW